MSKTTDGSSLEEQLNSVEVPEDRYRLDLDLHDRSIQFSAELLRIALAGIVVVGFIVEKFPKDLRDIALKTSLSKWTLAAAVIAFAISSGCALAHRFFAGGAAFHHSQVIKLLILPDAHDSKALTDAKAKRTRLFLRCHRYLILASSCLVIGAGLLAITFAIALGVIS